MSVKDVWLLRCMFLLLFIIVLFVVILFFDGILFWFVAM